MNTARDSLLRSDDEEDLVFDQTGLLTNKVSSRRPGFSRTFIVNSGGRITVARTVNLCLSFFGLGLCFAIPTATLDDLQQSTGTDHRSIEYIFTARHGGYILGCLVGGFLFDCYNRQFLLFLSLLATSVGIIVMPLCTQLATLMACTAVTGLTMGFLDTGGNVWCLDLWGRHSAPFMQALHFCFGLGALVAPLVAEPFLPATTLAGMPGAIGDNLSDFVHVPRVSHLGLHPPLILSNPMLTNETWRHKRDVANDTAETFNITLQQVDTEENATLLHSLSSSSGNASEAPATPSAATPANVSSVKKPMKPTYTEAQHQGAMWDRKSQKGMPQNPQISLAKNASATVQKNGTAAATKNVSSSLQGNGTSSNETSEYSPSNVTVPLSVPANKSTALGVTSRPAENLFSNTSTSSLPAPSPSTSTDVPAASSTEAKVVTTVDSASTASALSTSTVASRPTEGGPVATTPSNKDSGKSTSGQPEETTPKTTPVPDLHVELETTADRTETMTQSSAAAGLLLPHTTDGQRETTTQQPLHSTNDPKESSNFIVSHFPSTKATETSPTPRVQVNLTSLLGTVPTEIDQTWWFTRNQLGRFQIAYVILGAYLFLVAAVFLAFLCASPRESRSRQDEDLVRASRPGSQRGLVLLTALFFFFYMVLEADVGELLHGLPARRSPVTFAPRGYFLTYVFWGSFAAARGLSIALATKLSCRTMLVGDLSICLLASVLLVAGGDRMDLLLWSGVGVLGLGMASILPTTLVWLERHIRVTNRTASVLLLSAAFGDLVLTVLTNTLAQHEHVILMYVNVAVVTLCCLNFAGLWLAGSKHGEKYASHPDRSLYQLANFDEDEVVELNGSRPLWGNGTHGILAVKRKTNGSI